MMVLTIALFIFQSESFAQEGTLTDNATFPTSVSALTVQGSSATEGSALSFIKFKLTPNLPSTTPGSFVAKATLTLYVGSLNTSGSFNVYRVTSSWGESDTTAPTYDDANPVIIGVPVTTANSYVTVDLTALTQQWLGADGLGTGGVPNYGIALVANTTTTAFSFDSKESTTTSHPARLSILLNHAATADIATDFTGTLAGDVTGTQNATVVSSVGSQSAASVVNGTIAANSATDNNTPGTIVKRDASGNFSAGTIVGSITGNAATATNATNATNADIAKSVVRAAQDTDIASPADGQLYYNTTLNVFKVFDGPTSTWKIVDAGATSTLSSSATISGNQVNGELTNVTIAGSAVTGNIAASQISGNITNATIAGYVTKVGDTMTGALNLPANGLKAGTNQLVLSGGNIGIGTTSPQAKLDVSGDVLLHGITVGRGSGAIGGNVVMGINSLVSNTTGFDNVAIGKDVLTANTTGNDNLAIGFETLNHNTIGTYNVAVGVWALRDNISGQGNSALGVATLVKNTTANYNTAVGYTALYSNTTGTRNTAVGQNALAKNLIGNKNTAVGVNSLQNNTGSDNTSVGFGALLANTSGVSNSAFGEIALTSNTTGDVNSAFGLGALQSNVSGDFNAAVGVNAGRSLTTGSFNTFIGSAPGPSASQKVDAQNSTAIGYGAYTTADNQVVIGNTSVTETLLSGNVGIGISPTSKLTVAGVIESNDGGFKFPDGTTQTTAATFSSSTTISGNQVNGELTNATIAGSRVTGEVANATNATTAVTANALSSGATVPGSQVSGDIPGKAASITGTITGNQVSSAVAEATHATNADNATNAVNATTAGNASAVTNGVYTVGDQTVEGNKTFTNPIVGSITGNAATATNATNATNADVAKSLNRAAQDADIASPADGQVYYNTSSNVFKVFDGATSTWKIVDAGNTVTPGGTITGVTGGTGLTGGGTSGNVTLNVNQGMIAFQSDLASELSTRQSADTTLQNNINSEASDRIAADAALQTAVDGKVAKAGDTMSGTLNLPTNGLVVGSTQLVLSGNKVGIGTDTPQTKLQINGGSVYVGSAGQGIVLKSPDGSVCKLLTIDNTGAMVLSAITCP